MGLLSDAKNIQNTDPAGVSLAQVLFLYPGFHILIFHRVAHWLYRHRRFFLARMVSQIGRNCTGIEIHPGATIGNHLFIDHGMGIVIGETAEVGNDVTIYHGVTLGGTGKDTGKRHPTVRDGVLIGAGVKVLGPVVIGERSRIGANSTVLDDVPCDATAVGSPAVVVRSRPGISPCSNAAKPSGELDQSHFPNVLEKRISELEKKLSRFERQESHRAQRENDSQFDSYSEK